MKAVPVVPAKNTSTAMAHSADRVSMYVVVGMIENAAGEVLIAKRTEHQYMSGVWEFPGGKLNPGETAFEALQRELFEELGIHVVSAESWCQLGYDYTDRVVFLDAWIVTQYTGEPHGAENQPVRWVRPESLAEYTFPSGNERLLQKWCSEKIR